MCVCSCYCLTDVYLVKFRYTSAVAATYRTMVEDKLRVHWHLGQRQERSGAEWGALGRGTASGNQLFRCRWLWRARSSGPVVTACRSTRPFRLCFATLPSPEWMRGSMVSRLRPCMIISTPPPPSSESSHLLPTALVGTRLSWIETPYFSFAFCSCGARVRACGRALRGLHAVTDCALFG